MKGILLVSFGSTHERARKEEIDAVAERMQAAFPDALLVQAYTSGMIRRALAKRGVEVPSVSDALDEMLAQGVTDLLVQPTHIMPGDEHGRMLDAVKEKQGLFARVCVGDPLLATDADVAALVAIVGDRFSRAADTAVVLMGHGSENFANVVYAALDYRFKAVGRDDVYVGTVEAYPSIDDVMERMAPHGYARVVLAPLMLVAGDHAVNDMAGDEEDSWSSVLGAAGYETQCFVEGLGALAGVQDLYVAHARSAWEA